MDFIHLYPRIGDRCPVSDYASHAIQGSSDGPARTAAGSSGGFERDSRAIIASVLATPLFYSFVGTENIAAPTAGKNVADACK
ncbi:MAG: hypothetical protein ABSC37_07640 [Xanthobacteraceae bacterium]|jgi:hypothetical protein